MTRSTRQGEGRKGTRQARSDKSRDQILLAALDLALEHGYQGTTMAAVSASSGLPIGSVYWHFKSKEQLFVALLEHCYQAWMELHSGPEGLRRKLSRGIAGTAGRTLIVNLPGSTGGVRDGLAVLGPLLPHVVSQLRGGDH